MRGLLAVGSNAGFCSIDPKVGFGIAVPSILGALIPAVFSGGGLVFGFWARSSLTFLSLSRESILLSLSWRLLMFISMVRLIWRFFALNQ